MTQHTTPPQTPRQHPPPSDEERLKQQQEAVQTIGRWLEQENLLVLDTETTGIENAYVWEVAAINIQGEMLLNFTCNIGEVTWSEQAAKMHAARRHLSTQGSPPSFYRKALGKAAQAHQTVTYGAAFDHEQLTRTFSLEDLPEFGCVMTVFAPLGERWSKSRGVWKYLSLTEACLLYDVDITPYQTHQALDDVILVILLMKAVVKKHAEWLNQTTPSSISKTRSPENT